ncbi:MAG: xanthine dehydrogenase family protein molybdopterin-binding subunit [Hyphomicrobiales bacterium]|nr:MAG: xanthine dehydrogenase family protein molybdopterin-binding subunit [Hyphomicrobiales bacterium]
MSLHEANPVSRRAVLGSGAATALMVGLRLPWSERAAHAQSAAAPAEIGAWVRISADDTVTLLLSQVEIGQGISTTLPAILADELGADWARVHVENSPVAAPYRNPRINWMFTGNSESIQSFAPHLRKAGAAAREMLIAVAAKRWNVSPDTCGAENGQIVHGPSGRQLKFGDVAVDAARLPVPADPRIKGDTDLRLVGRALPRRDIPAKVDGSAVFGIDVKVPGMVHAAIRHAPAFGGTVAAFDAPSVTQRPGVIAVVPLQNAVAVVAERFWQAKTAADALSVTFTDGPNTDVSSATLAERYRAVLNGTEWKATTSRGDAPAAVAAAGAQAFTRDYDSPFQAHATMEPMNCTASVTADVCELWVPTQGQQLTEIVAASVTGLKPEQIKINWTYCGGGFGRRLLADFVAQAIVISKAVERPVKLIWTREEDMAHDFYRPATLTRLSAVPGANGAPTALAARLVSPTQLQAVNGSKLPDHVDPRVTEGLEDTRYDIADFRLDYHKLDIPIPTSVLRTTGFGPNIFALESFIDELAHAAGQDPYRFRRKLLAKDSRALRVLDLAAEKSDWDKPLPKGRARGIAFCDGFETIIAQVVELSVGADKAVRVHSLTTVADPGRLFDPGIGASNLEAGALFGLSSAFKSKITFEAGRTVQQNFDGYDLVHLWEAPPIVTTHFVESPGEKIGGLGEVGPVSIPPAVANAIFAATGARVRSLPLADHGYTLAASSAA